jgi:hypothetical protein
MTDEQTNFICAGTDGQGRPFDQNISGCTSIQGNYHEPCESAIDWGQI